MRHPRGQPCVRAYHLSPYGFLAVLIFSLPVSWDYVWCLLPLTRGKALWEVQSAEIQSPRLMASRFNLLVFWLAWFLPISFNEWMKNSIKYHWYSQVNSDLQCCEGRCWENSVVFSEQHPKPAVYLDALQPAESTAESEFGSFFLLYKVRGVRGFETVLNYLIGKKK